MWSVSVLPVLSRGRAFDCKGDRCTNLQGLTVRFHPLHHDLSRSRYLLWFSKSTFPHRRDAPSKSQCIDVHFHVTHHILFELFLPEPLSCPRISCETTTRVAMPEASMYIYEGIIAPRHNVRPAGQQLSMETKPQSQPMQCTSERKLWTRICSFDAPHHS